MPNSFDVVKDERTLSSNTFPSHNSTWKIYPFLIFFFFSLIYSCPHRIFSSLFRMKRIPFSLSKHGRYVVRDI